MQQSQPSNHDPAQELEACKKATVASNDEAAQKQEACKTATSASDEDEVEEVSLDDHGFPKMLQTPEMKRYMGPSPAKAATKASLPLKKSKPTSHMKELEAAAAAAEALAEETLAKATKPKLWQKKHLPKPQRSLHRK